ncbi:CoA transferase [Oceanibium sediminis]|uniref:CoA transferase n=1 Tax=Oceanibium sediminis TaxID=2026339 RepID=UPI000DD3F1FD|nr:CoA transferase [Oceanibium sediminis]
MTDVARHMLAEMTAALGGAETPLRIEGEDRLASAFAVSDLASAAIGAAGCALSDYAGRGDPVVVDQRRASLWFHMSLRPQGWDLPAPWDSVAGDYAARDGWIRLHTNAAHHKAAALSVLGAPAERDAVAAAVKGWNRQALEAAVVAAGGCAAAMHSAEEWATHPQGAAVAAEPLIDVIPAPRAARPSPALDPDRPLRGVRVLDLTRILAGPVATRFLAGFGADVLRLDPPDWEEPALEAEVTPGKTCARLDLKSAPGQARFLALLAEADVLIHGYRADALDGLGLGQAVRQKANPGLIDVALNAYGWTGPWTNRRGFDSLVQMSSGIAEAGQARFGAERPVPLPVQALDHAAGYLLAAAALRGLVRRRDTGHGHRWRTSLARVAALLMRYPAKDMGGTLSPGGVAQDFTEAEATPWGPAHRLPSPLSVGGAQLSFARPAGPLGADRPGWQDTGPAHE